MQYADIQDCLNADQRTSVLAYVPESELKVGKLTIQDAINFYEWEEGNTLHSYEVAKAEQILGKGAENFYDFVDNCREENISLSVSVLNDIWAEFWSKHQEEKEYDI